MLLMISSHYGCNFDLIIIKISIIIFDNKFQGWLLGNHIYVKYSLFYRLLGYIWFLGTFFNSSCDIKRNIKIFKITVET